MIMTEQFRKMENTNYSPKSSPHGGRSPVVSRQDSSGTLKATISLGKTPTIIQTGPFYALKEPPRKGELTGDKDLMTEYGLHHTLTKFKDKKFKESLASFLPNLPGIVENITDIEDSTLRSMVDKPPVASKEISTFNCVQLAGFRLHFGPLPETYRVQVTTLARKHKHKQKKQKDKQKDGLTLPDINSIDFSCLETYEKKHKKQKRHEDDKERKKRKKEKKRKKKSHSPEPPSSGGVSPMMVSSSSSILAGPTQTANNANITTTMSALAGLTSSAANVMVITSGLPSSAAISTSLTTQPTLLF